jgi:rhodanese-related sulfurtransferase
MSAEFLKPARRFILAGLCLLAAVAPAPAQQQMQTPPPPEQIKTAAGATWNLVEQRYMRVWNESKTAYVMLDVRTVAEHDSQNYPRNAKVIPFSMRTSDGHWQDNPSFLSAVRAAIRPEEMVVVWMTVNERSRAAAAALADAGYRNVFAIKYSGVMDDSDHPVVTADTIRQWLDRKVPFRIFDVQSQQEHESYGYPAGAVCIPLNLYDETTKSWSENPAFVEKISAAAGKDEKIVIICTVGWRAGIATRKLLEAGFTDVQSFRYGIRGRSTGDEYEIRAPGWVATGLPFVKGPEFGK